MRRRIFYLLSLFAAVLASARDKPQNWLEVRSPHFVVVSNAGEKQIRHVAGQFERMRLVFHTQFPDMEVDSASPVIVLAMKDENSFRALEPSDYIGKGKLQLAGLFQRTPDKNYVLLRLDAGGDHPYATVYHEYTHLLTSKAEAWLPLWLSEGFAEFFQNTDIHDNEVDLGEPSEQNLRLLQQNRLLPLGTLFAVDHNSPYYHEQDKGSIFYAESWVLTHYIKVHDYKENGHRLLDYAALLSRGMDPVTAGTRAFGDLALLQKSLEKYVEQASFTYFRMPIPTQIDESAFQAKALPEPQADAVRADFLAYDNRAADSRALLEEVLRQDPKNVSAFETMGFLAFRAGQMDEALKWYGEAVKLDSQSYLAQYYFAMISMRGGAIESENEVQAEKSLQAAIKLNPKFAPAYANLAGLYTMHDHNFEEARALCLQAIELDPGNFDYRMNLANVLVALNRAKDATSVIEKAMSMAKSPAQAERARMYLERVQRFEAPPAMDSPTVTTHSKEELSASTSDPSALTDNPPVLLHRQEVAPTGPHRFATGTIKNVVCTAPSTMDFDVVTSGPAIKLHNGDYFKIQFSALNFTPEGDLLPCSQLEGVRAKVEYIAPADKAAKEWIVAVEMRK